MPEPLATAATPPTLKSLRIAFAGTPPFAAVALQRLLDAGGTLALVLTQPDRPAGRGMKLQASAVKQLALAHGVPVAQPRSLRLDGKFAQDAAEAQRALQAARPDVIVVAAYGLILPAWVLGLPRLGCVNIHASLLPRWRGAAPVQRAIEAGDAATGVCLMQMDEGLDTGDVLRAQPLAIAADDTAASLTARLADLGAGLLLHTLRELADGTAVRTPQPAVGVSYAHKIDKVEALIDWRCDAAQIERRVRAFDPFPGASFEWRGETVKLWRAAWRRGAGGAPGSLSRTPSDTPLMACGSDALELLELQRPGARRVTGAQWLRSQAGG